MRPCVAQTYACDDSLGQLFAGFFAYYRDAFDVEQSTVSLRTGAALHKANTYKDSKAWRLSIEDPFELTHDLGRVLTTQGQDAVTAEMGRAWELLLGRVADVSVPVGPMAMKWVMTRRWE